MFRLELKASTSLWLNKADRLRDLDRKVPSATVGILGTRALGVMLALRAMLA